MHVSFWGTRGDIENVAKRRRRCCGFFDLRTWPGQTRPHARYTLVRTVALLIAAISMSRPAIPKDEATRYAKILNEIGSKYDFDPLLAVSMIHYESRWLPGIASDDGEDY